MRRQTGVEHHVIGSADTGVAFVSPHYKSYIPFIEDGLMKGPDGTRLPMKPYFMVNSTSVIPFFGADQDMAKGYLDSIANRATPVSD